MSGPWEAFTPSASASPGGSGWDKVNADYAAGAGERQQEQLRILTGELQNETDPKNQEILKREIANAGGKPPEVKPGNPWEQFKPSQKEAKPEQGTGARIGSDIAGVADMIISFPGQVLGTLVGTAESLGAQAGGASHEEVQQIRKEAIQKYTEANPLNNPIHAIMVKMGYQDGYGKTDVDHVMKKVAGGVGKGGEWIEKMTGGVVGKGDFEDLTNSAINLFGAKVVGAGVKGVKKLIGKGPEELKIREEPTLEPEKPKPEEQPKDLAKRHIEKTLNIKTPEEQAAYNKAARKDARIAYSEDPQYADYLKNYAEEEVRQRESAAEKKANEIEAQKAANTIEIKAEPKEGVTWNEALPILKKPGFQRTPEELVKLRQFNRQGGQASPETLAKMAAVGIAVGVGVNLDPEHPVEGALLGFTVAAGAAYGLKNMPTVAKGIRDIFKEDDRIRIGEIADRHEIDISKAGRLIWQKQLSVTDVIKDPVRREAVTKWLQGNKKIPLSDAEYNSALSIRKYFDSMGAEAMKAGVLDHVIDDYVTGFWDLSGKNQAIWDKISSNMSPESKFALKKKIQSYEEGIKLGLKPVSMDIAHIMGQYGASLTRTMANKQLIESLKTEKIPGTANTLMMSAKDAPRGYVQINHPQMMGRAVHPDIAPSLEFFFTQKSPRGIVVGLEAVNTALKRSAVSFSLFHAKALTDAYIGAGGNPLKIPGMITGTNKFLKMLREGGAGDLIDKAYEGGLKFSLDKGVLADEDIGGAFYAGMEMLQKTADKMIPGSGKIIKGVENINHAADTLMWARLHTGMKLEIFAKTREKLLQNNLAESQKNPNYKMKSDKEISSIAASYTNDLFGGLNWRRIAEESRTKWGRDLAQNVYSPTGRRAMQLLLFAPDWTISTTRAAVKAFGQGSGVKGLVKPKELADLHRQYLLRSALYYATVGGAINYALSGHHIWENKDPTVIELGDGRVMQFSKHAMEPLHWLMKPGQQALNKLGFIPKEVANQALGSEYLTSYGKPPPMDTSVAGRARHLLKNVKPIAFESDNTTSFISSSLGFPIYGKTEEQRELDKERRAEARRKKKEEEE